jgi:Cu(I)/Ag(I) efflux system membrane fusion protein
MSKKLWIFIIIVIVVAAGGYFIFTSRRPPERKILYYQSGMHPWIKSDEPGKCPICGMDLMPVYEDEIKLSLPEVKEEVYLSQNELKHLNVKTQAVSYLPLFKEIRTVGVVAYDPELIVTQEEFIAALESDSLVDSGRRKLRLLGMSEAQIDDLAETKKIDTNLILPENTMWVYADIYEQELEWVKSGNQAVIRSVSFPGEIFYGQVKAIDPVLDAMTRSAKARIFVKNPQLKLKPQMYVDVYMKSPARKVLAVPKEAVLDTGERKVAYVEKNAGVFEPRNVEVGAVSFGEVKGVKQKYFPVIKGLSSGEKVVISANFLIDSQSQLTRGSSVLYGGAKEIEDDR